jgi:hypothetical protein
MAAIDPAAVTYFEIDSAPGLKLFRCEQYAATLSVPACVKRFTESKRAIADDLDDERFVSFHHCARCKIGARHAGSDPVQPLMVGGMTCSRCHHPASRLIRSSICVPCYNRELEMTKGVNSKGTAPRPVDRFWRVDDHDGDEDLPRSAVVRPLRIYFSSGGDLPAERVIMASTTLESVIVVARSLPKTAPLPRFRMQPPRPQLRQSSLFGGC